MTTTTAAAQPVRAPLPALVAWRNALAIVVLLWVVIGLNFSLLAEFLVHRFPHQLLLATVLLDFGFALAAVVVVGTIVLWQRAHGETLADLGWRRPTTRVAIVVAVVYGLLWTALGYARGGDPLALSWERPVMMLIGPFLAFAEELAMRGFFMENLRRGGVPTWLQVVASGVLMGGYHGIVGLHYSLTYAASSAVLFTIVAAIYVLGRRSLTPGLLAHGMTHFLGDPTLTQGILVAVTLLG
jgi:hypothetical protein